MVPFDNKNISNAEIERSSLKLFDIGGIRAHEWSLYKHTGVKKGGGGGNFQSLIYI